MNRQLIAFFYRLKGYLAAPRDHGPELIVSAGILLVLAGILFVLFQMVWFRFAKTKYRGEIFDPPPPEPPPIRSPRRPWPRWLLVLMALFVLALPAAANLVPRYALGKASYCGSCHTMRRAVKSWRASSHSKVACAACHENPGVYGALRGQAQGLANIGLTALYFNRQRPTILKASLNGACLVCHRKIGRTTVLYKSSINVSHREFLEQVRCESCHPDAGHAGKRLKVKIKDRCLRCHRPAGTDTACAKCHVPEPVRQEAELALYGKTTIRYRSCRRCHDSEMRCKQCHGQPNNN